MILADKIINERKKNGWSQEQLAGMLSVSRQSVSKWEGAQAAPDLQKIISMAEIFGVSTDYLLKDEIESQERPNETTAVLNSAYDEEMRTVSLEEAHAYLEATRATTPKISTGVSLCIVSPVLLIFLAGFSESHKSSLSENMAAGIGIVVLLAFVATAVYQFITSGFKLEKYEYIEKEAIETAYGVDGMAKEHKAALESRRTSYITIGVIMCICCSIPLIVSAIVEASSLVIMSMVCLLLLIVAIAVNLFIRGNMEWECCNKLLQEGEFTIENKKSEKAVGKITSAYWLIATAIFLTWSFVTNDWHKTWIVWPIAGVLYSVVIIFAKNIKRVD